MGNFYVNIVTKDVTKDNLVKFLESEKYSAFIISSPNDYCTVYEQKSGEFDTNTLTSLLQDISKHFSCSAFGVSNYDDDILAYELWHDGIKIDEYNSSPDYFEENEGGNEEEEFLLPKGGDAQKLKTLLAANNSNCESEEIENILRAGFEDYIFAVERHIALAKILGLPPHSVGYGYMYIANQLPAGISENNVIKVG